MISATAVPAALDADLLLMAFKTFAELGYEGASIRDLTRREIPQRDGRSPRQCRAVEVRLALACPLAAWGE